MELPEFEHKLLAVLQKHQGDKNLELEDFLATMISALLIAVPANTLLMLQIVDNVLGKPTEDSRRRFLEEFRELIVELRRGQGH